MNGKRETTEEQSENLYRMLPSVNDVLLMEPVEALFHAHSHEAVVRATRLVLEELRSRISSEDLSHESLKDGIALVPAKIAEALTRPFSYSLRPVINATGVILHTNLGRAPLSTQALEHVVSVAAGYSNLEFDLESGGRGKRDAHVEKLLLRLFGEAAGIADLDRTHRATVVNNCAAATYLALHALAKGKEVVVSRGELVEIGGGFRIPQILEETGAILKEVGTTNRTRISDYESALSANTGLILRVHQSNFSMEGFVSRPRMDELTALGQRRGIPVFVDQGTGQVRSVDSAAMQGVEETIADCLGLGCDLVAASGDKLLGGPQCGILIGRRELIEATRKDPLLRTFRVDKMVYAALEATLASYLSGTPEQIPILRMLTATPQEIKARCEEVCRKIAGCGLTASVVGAESVVGGGTAPRAKLESHAVSLRHAEADADGILSELRRCDPAIVGRIEDGAVLLDLRTVDLDSDAHIAEVLRGLPMTSRSGGKRA